jgi:hypothetical protein
MLGRKNHSAIATGFAFLPYSLHMGYGCVVPNSTALKLASQKSRIMEETKLHTQENRDRFLVS